MIVGNFQDKGNQFPNADLSGSCPEAMYTTIRTCASTHFLGVSVERSTFTKRNTG